MWYFYVLSPVLSFSLHKERSRDVEVKKNANQGGTLFLFLFLCWLRYFPVENYEWRDRGESVNEETAIKPAAGK